MQKFVTVTTKNGLVVSGELVKTGLNTIDVKVSTPYFTKHYLDSSSTQTDELMSNGVKKVIFNNNASTLKRRKEYTIATINKSIITSM